MVFALLFLYLFILSFFGFGVVNKIIFEKKLVVSTLIIVIIAFSVVGCLISPNPMYDLSRHYSAIDSIIQNNFSLHDVIFRAQELIDYNYHYTYSFNLIFWLVAKLRVKELLPCISILISYGNLLYILFDYNSIGKRNNFISDNGYILLSLFLCFALMPYLYIYSGIRGSMAAAIAALAIYLFLWKENGVIRVIILFCIAGTMHPLCLAVIPFIIISKFKPNIITSLFVLFLPRIVAVIMEKMRFSGIGFFTYLGAKYYNYTRVYTYYQGRTFYVAPLIILMIILIIHILYSKKDSRIDNFIIWYALFSLSYYFSYQIFMRLPYVLAFLAPVIVKDLFSGAGKRNRIIVSFGALSVIFIGSFTCYQCICW